MLEEQPEPSDKDKHLEALDTLAANHRQVVAKRLFEELYASSFKTLKDAVGSSIETQEGPEIQSLDFQASHLVRGFSDKLKTAQSDAGMYYDEMFGGQLSAKNIDHENLLTETKVVSEAEAQTAKAFADLVRSACQMLTDPRTEAIKLSVTDMPKTIPNTDYRTGKTSYSVEKGQHYGINNYPDQSIDLLYGVLGAQRPMPPNDPERVERRSRQESAITVETQTPSGIRIIETWAPRPVHEAVGYRPEVSQTGDLEVHTLRLIPPAEAEAAA